MSLPLHVLYNTPVLYCTYKRRQTSDSQCHFIDAVKTVTRLEHSIKQQNSHPLGTVSCHYSKQPLSQISAVLTNKVRGFHSAATGGLYRPIHYSILYSKDVIQMKEKEANKLQLENYKRLQIWNKNVTQL